MKLKLIITFSILYICLLVGCGSNFNKTSGLTYTVLDSGREYAIIHLKSDANPEQMDIVADSIFDATSHKKLDSYHVMFYYREDYKGHVCYADKLWFWNKEMNLEKGKLSVTGVKSVDP